MDPEKITQLIKLITVDKVDGDVIKIGKTRSIKAVFKDLAIEYLKHLAKQLGLTDFEVSFNPGGPAVGGEAMLHSDRVFVQIGGGSWAVLYRRCIRRDQAPRSRAARKKAKPNYESTQFGNQWFNFQDLADVPKVVERLREVHG